jgi:hypothetical protein
MIRNILISATLLAAFAGAANAGEMKVSLHGKTEAAVRAELFDAAQTVCKDADVAEYSACVHETYQVALITVAKAKATKLASLTF